MITTVAIAASFASCNKIEQDNSTTPVEAPAVDGTTTLTISATSPQTKTYLVDNADNTAKNTNWTKGDVVTLFGLEDKAVTATASNAGNASATVDFTFAGWPAAITPAYLVFDGPLAEQTGGNSVVSPVYNEDGTITATVRSLQVITNKSNMSKYANLSIGKVEEIGGAHNTVMRNVCGLIKFELGGGKTTSVEDVVIKDALGNPMTGLVKVDYNEGQPEVVGVVEPADYVQVKANITDYNNKMLEGVYYACVLPGTYSPEITINHTDGTVTTLKMPEGQTVTIERSQIFDFTTIYDPTPETGEGDSEDDPVTPPTPTKTLTLTLDCISWPFDEEAVTKAKTTDEVGDDLTLIRDGVSYTFNIRNTVGGYYHTGSALRGNNKKAGDFRLKLPVIADMKLVEVQVEVTNAPNATTGADNAKYIKITGAGSVVSCTINSTNGLTTLVTNEPVIGGQCALESGGNNVQFKTIILKYTN